MLRANSDSRLKLHNVIKKHNILSYYFLAAKSGKGPVWTSVTFSSSASCSDLASEGGSEDGLLTTSVTLLAFRALFFLLLGFFFLELAYAFEKTTTINTILRVNFCLMGGPSSASEVQFSWDAEHW